MTKIFEQKIVSFLFDRTEEQLPKFPPVELWDEAVY